MKNGFIKRTFALLLCLAMLVGFVPAGLLFDLPQVSAASDTAPQSDIPINLVQNGNFDNGREGWSITNGTGSSVEITDGVANLSATTGSICLKQSFEVGAYEMLELKLKYKWVSGSDKPYVGLWFFKGTNWVTTKKVDVSDKTGTWVEIVINAVVPAGADLVEVEIGNNSQTKVSYQIDKVTLTKDQNDYVFVETFEMFKNGSNGNPSVKLGPIGWTDSDPSNGSAVMSYNNYYQNSYSLFFQKDNTWAKGSAFAVTPGKEYTASFVTQRHGGATPSGYAKLVFQNAEGEKVGEEKVGVGNGPKYAGSGLTNWQEEKLTAVAPAAAVTAYIEFGRETTGSSYGVDNIFVSEGDQAVVEPTVPTETTPSEPAPVDPDKLVQNGDFADGKNGWSAQVSTPSTFEVADGIASLNVSKGSVCLKQTFDAKNYEIYELKLRYKWISGNDKPYVGLWFFSGTNSNENWVTTKKIDIADKSGKWVDIVVTASVPYGADIVEIQIGNNSGATVSYQIDDITLTKSGSNYIFGETFENFKSGSNGNPSVPLGPIGWTDSDPSNGSAVMAYNNYYQNSYSLFFQADNTWAKSPEFDVEAGQAYALNYYARKMASNSEMTGYVLFVFLDADGASISAKKATAGTTFDDWTKETMVAAAPDGAVKAYLLFGCETAKGTYGIDNISVTETTEPETPGDDPVDPPATEPVDPPATDPIPTDPIETEPIPEDPNNLLVNGSFGDDKNGWTEQTNAPSTLEVIDGVASFTAAGGGITLKQTFEAKRYEVYELKARYRWISGDTKPYIGLWFFHDKNTNDNWITTTKVDIGDKSGQWVDVIVTAIVPEGADIVEVQMGNNSGAEVNYQIDNVVLTKNTETYVFAEGFENFNVGDNGKPNVGLGPVGWTDSDPDNGSAVHCYGKYYQKSYSLFFQADNTWAKSPEFEVKAGHAYTVTYFAKKMANNMHKTGYMEITFLDANGEVLRTKRITAGTNMTDWVKEGTIAVAPEGAVKAFLLFGCETAKSTYGIDNVTVAESEEIADPDIENAEPPAGVTDPTKLQNTDFEAGLDKWVGYSNPGATTTVVTEGAYKGQSILFTAKATETEKANNCRYQVIEVGDITAFELTAWTKRVSGDGNAYIGLWFYDVDGVLIPENTAYTVNIAKSEEWTQSLLIQEVPQGAMTVRVEFGNNSGYVIDYMIDEVNIQPYTGPSENINPAIKPGTGSSSKYPAVIVDAEKLNGSMEELDEYGMPVGWRLVGVPTYTMIKADDAPHGNYYMQMAKTEAGGNSMHSPRIPCTPGETYELKVMARDIVGTCRIGIYVYDKDGNRIDEACKVVLTDGSGKWKMYLIQQAMPENAAGVELEVWGVKSQIFTVQIDALAIGISEEKVKPPYVPTPYEYPTIEELTANLSDVYPRVYFTPEEAKEIKLRRFNSTKTKYGWSWSKQYKTLLNLADGYMEVETVNVGMNTGKSVNMNIWEDVNSQHNRDMYLAASFDDDGTKFEEPYTGFGCLIQDQLSDMMKAWSMAYIMTGKTKYSDQAIKMAMNIASWEWWIDKNWTDQKKIDADASIAWMMEGMVAVYDMCYNEMTPEQRKTLERSIIEKGLIPLSKQVDPNSTVNGNMMMVGGILSGAAVILNKDNAEEIYPYLQVGLLAMHNALDNYAFSGNTEGHYYTDYGLETFVPGVGHIYRATQMDGIIDHYFFTDILPYWTIMWASSVTGTHPNYSDGSINAYMKLPMAVLAKLTNDPLIDGFLCSAGGTGDTFNNLVYLNGDPLPEYMTDHAAVVDEFGYGALRTGFADTDMLLTLKANDSHMGHNHYDQNSILLAVGPNWLIRDPGAGSYYLQDRTFWTHDGHSTILVDGSGQLIQGTASTQMVFNNNLYSYIIGSAPRAYGADFDSRILDKFDRHAIQVNHEDKGYYVLIDDLLSSKNRVYTWQMYNGTRSLFSVDGVEVPEETMVMGNSVSLPMGKNVLNLNFIDGDKLEIGDKVYKSNGNPVGTTLVANSAATKAHQFMTVISADSNSLSNYISFYDILAGGRSTNSEYIVEGEISWDSSMPIGQEILKPNMIGTTPVVFFRGNKAGDWIEIPFNVEDTGVYEVKLSMGVSDGCCKIKATFDGEIASDVVDCSGLPEEMIDIDFGQMDLEKGMHTVRIEVVAPGEDEDYAAGWYLINAGGIDLMQVGVEIPPAEDLVVTEVIDNEEALAGMINYKDNKYDFLMWNRTEGAATAGLLNTDAQQASVLGLIDGNITEGFAATNATTATYDGKVLFVSQSKVDIVASSTGWQVIADAAQVVQLTAIEPELDYVVTVNGEETDARIENGLLNISVEAGETAIAVVVEEPEVIEPTEPEETDPTEPPTEAPTAVPTEPVDNGGNNAVLWIVIATAVVLVAGAAVGIVLFLKKRKAST